MMAYLPVFRNPKLFLIALCVFLLPLGLHASHLEGGEVKYTYLGQNQANGLHQYRITFYIYNNCALSSEIPNGKPQILVNIYSKDTNQRIAGPDNTMQQSGLWLFQRGPSPIITNPLPTGCSIPAVEALCIRYITYERVVELPMSFSGYYVIYDDFARTNSIVNLDDPGTSGQSIYTDMTSPIQQNTSPVFSDMAVAIICQSDTVQLSNNASDPEGDFLVYSFDLPLNDVLGAGNSPTTWIPPVSVPYAPGYSFTQPFGAGGFASINASTGVTKYFAPNSGDYVVAILIKEFRTNPDGSQTQIGFTRRELMLFVRTCPPNTAPVFSSATLNSLTANVQAGSQVCLPVSASDPSGQQLTLSAPAGSIPAGATFSPALPATGTGTISNLFCWTPPCTASGMVQIPVKVTDSGCPPKFSEQVFTINITPLPTANFTGLEAGSYCLGSGNMAMAGTPAGGIFAGPGVSGSAFNPTAAGLGTHTISYTHTSATGCVTTTSQTVTVNQGPTITVSGLESNFCLSSGAVTLTASPAGGTFAGPGISGNTFTPSLAGSGPKTITYTVTSANGCTSVQQLNTTVFAQPVVTATPATTLCAGGSTTLQATGANTYTWTNNQNSAELTGNQVSVSPGTTTVYTVSGVVTTGCSAVATTTVTVSPIPTVAAVAAQATVCAGQSTQLTASGAATYLWQPGNGSGAVITVTPNASTTYSVTGTSAAGCSASAVVPVTVIPLPVVAASGSLFVCAGNSTTLSATGANGYVWQPGGSTGNILTVTPANTTNYTVTGTGSNGCTNTAQATVEVFQVPVPTITLNGPSTFCQGSGAALTAGFTGPINTIYSFAWLLNGNPVTPLVANPVFAPTVSGTYSYQITHGMNLCSTVSNEVTVTVLPAPTVAASAPQAICLGQPATLSASGAGSYLWQPGGSTSPSLTVFPSVTTTYSVSGTGTNGCSATATTTVTVNPVPAINLSAAQTICSGSSITLTASGAAIPYTWQPGNVVASSVTVSPSVSTTFTVTGTLPNGCSNQNTTNVTVVPVPVVAANAAQTVCAGTPVILSATGATTYTWQPGNLTGSTVSVSPIVSTTYTVTGIGTNGCTNTATTQVIVNALPALATSAPQTICIGSSVTLSASGANTYTWQPGGTTGNTLSVTPANTTNYTVSGEGANGCTSTAVTTVTVNGLPVVGISGNQPVCEGNSVTLSGTGAATYSWSPGTGLSATTGISVLAMPSGTTTYTLTGTDVNGCVNTSMATLIVNPLPALSVSVAQAVCAGQPAILTASGIGNFSWQPGNFSGPSISVSPEATTTYTATISDTNGCSSLATSTVTVNPLPAPAVISGPNAFCNGSFTGLTYSVPGGLGSAFNWTVTAGTIAAGNTSNTVVVNLNGNQSAQISVTETSAEGCAGLPNNLAIAYDTASAEMLVVTLLPDNEEQIQVNWEIPGQVTANELFLFKRLSGTSSWGLAATLPGNAISFTDTPGNTSSQSYEYQVRTTNSCADSLKTIPQRSVLLSGTANEATAEVQLNWNAYRGWTTGVREYQIFRKLDNEADFSLYQTVTDTSAMFTIGREGFVHCFRIKAVSNDVSTRESWSNSICLTFENQLAIPNVITPNGDGKNDFFVIDNIALYRNAELVIMNRWGKEIFRQTNYRNNWQPATDLPAGTYYYQLILQSKKVLNGWLSILR